MVKLIEAIRELERNDDEVYNDPKTIQQSEEYSKSHRLSDGDLNKRFTI